MVIRRMLRCGSAAGAVAIMTVSAPGHASAQPPAVPDLSSLSDVTSDHVLDNPRGQAGFIFATPDGFGCSGGANAVSCNGTMPGMDGIAKVSGSGPCDVGEARADTAFVRLQHYMTTCPAPANGNILNPGQKVAQGSTTCGVLSGGVTACTTGPHGFVLQPSGSYSF